MLPRLPASAGEAPQDATWAEKLACRPRWGHLFRIIAWPWLLRSAHMVQFAVWFFLIAVPFRVANG